MNAPCQRFGSPALGAFDASENKVVEKREGVIKWKILVSDSCDHERYSAVQFGTHIQTLWRGLLAPPPYPGQDTRKVDNIKRQLFTWSCTLTKTADDSSETSEPTYQTTRRHII